MDELELLEYARTSVWSAEKALRLTLEPGIGWSLVDDLVLAQTAITEKIEDLTRARLKKGLHETVIGGSRQTLPQRATKPTITPTGEWLRGQRTTRPEGEG